MNCESEFDLWFMTCFSPIWHSRLTGSWNQVSVSRTHCCEWKHCWLLFACNFFFLNIDFGYLLFCFCCCLRSLCLSLSLCPSSLSNLSSTLWFSFLTCNTSLCRQCSIVTFRFCRLSLPLSSTVVNMTLVTNVAQHVYFDGFNGLACNICLDDSSFRRWAAK